MAKYEFGRWCSVTEWQSMTNRLRQNAPAVNDLTTQNISQKKCPIDRVNCNPHSVRYRGPFSPNLGERTT